MKKLLAVIRWELMLQARNQIITAAVFVTLAYMGIFLLLPFEDIDPLVILLVFSDPAMLGFVFIGVLILFEKNERTLTALVVTPISPHIYLWAKALTLSFTGWLCSWAMAIVGHGWAFNHFYFALAVWLTSLLCLWLGFWACASVDNLNQLILRITLFLFPLCLPLLNFFGITDTLIFYVIPSQASLLLFDAAFGKILTIWEWGYAIGYLLLSGMIAYYGALWAFRKYLIK